MILATLNLHRLSHKDLSAEPETERQSAQDMFRNFQENFLDVVVRLTDRKDPCRTLGTPLVLLGHVFDMVAPAYGAQCAAQLKEILVLSSHQGDGPSSQADRYIVEELDVPMPQLNAVYIGFLAVARKRVEISMRAILDVPCFQKTRTGNLVARYQEVYLMLCTAFQQALERCVLVALNR